MRDAHPWMRRSGFLRAALLVACACACGSSDDEPGDEPAGSAGTQGGGGNALAGRGGTSEAGSGGNATGTAGRSGGSGGSTGTSSSSSVPTVSSCSSDGFCWLNPLPTGVQLTAVHGSAPDDVWAVGGLGYVLHWDGAEWSRVASPEPIVPLRSVWAFSPTDVWVAGGDRVNSATSLAFHWDGASWTAFDTGEVEAGQLWGSTPSDVWLRGWSGGALLHYDGTAWTTNAAPVPDSTDPDTVAVQSIWGSTPDDVWIVAQNVSQDTWRVSRWDGAAWNPVPLPPEVMRPQSLFGRSATDVLLIVDEAPDGWLALYAWDGSGWSRLPDSPAVASVLPSNTSYGAQLGGGNGHAFVFDTELDRTKPLALAPLAARTDDGWSVETVAAPDPKNIGPYNAIWAAASGEAWAVGEAGAIGHREAGSWTQYLSGDNDTSLRSGWGTQATSFLVGAEPNRVLRYADDALSEVFAFEATGPKDIALIGVSESDVWAGVDGYDRLLTHFDGTRWRPQFRVGSVKLSSDGQGAYHHAIPGWLFTTHDTTGCVMDTCDYGSGHVRTDGVTEERLPSCLQGVRGSPGGVFAVGPTEAWYLMTNQPTPLENVSHAVHVVGDSCTATVLPAPPDVIDPQYSLILGTSATDIWALGSRIVAHYDGVSWTPSSSSINPLKAVIGTSGLWVIGQAIPDGVYRLEDGTWSHMDTFGLDRAARGIWMADDGAILVSGDQGALLRRDAEP